MPAALSETPAGEKTLIVFFFIFSWTIIASILPDIRDRAGDAAAGIRTVPVIIGTRRTTQVLTAFTLLSGLVIFALGRGTLSGAGLWTVGASLAYSQACILLVNRAGDTHFICDVLSDGQFIPLALIASLPGLVHFPFSPPL
ncbi:MAG: UbiA family prenyltransferase [Methanolinea sp.]|nr:UbiA family prenyltransferase [Methanolinea sp.]